MRKFTQQSSRFNATPAQIEYLRAIHQGYPSNTNWATRNRCFRFLVFGEHGGMWVKPEIVAQFKLDQVTNPPAPQPVVGQSCWPFKTAAELAAYQPKIVIDAITP